MKAKETAQNRQERCARLIWSLIAEPTDPIAQFARAALGPLDALAAARTATARDLLGLLGDRLPGDPAEPARAAPHQRAERALARWRARLETTDVDAVARVARDHRMRLLTPGDDGWPDAVQDLGPAAPVCLWVRGSADAVQVAQAQALALVGARASTPYGEDTAAALAAGAVRSGRVVISGGAYGIDAAAHRGALAAAEPHIAPGDGAPPTIAILAGGLDALYPRGNTALLEQVMRNGLLLSEAPPGTAPTRWRFLARNRLIAAISGATVVVEAAWRSGALSTARWADDLSRPVGAVPGPVSSASSAGCHRLVRERGAVLVTDAAEALELLPGGDAVPDGVIQDELDLLSPADRRVLDAVPPRSSRSAAAIAGDIGFSLGEVEAACGRLELVGAVERAGDQVRRPRTARR